MKLNLFALPLLATLASSLRLDPVWTQYNVQTGAQTWNTPEGLIRKNADITTIYTFDFGYSNVGKTCTFGFDRPYESTGTKQADLFSVIGNPTSSTTGFPRQAPRNQYIARLQVGNDLFGATTWISPSQAPSFPCPSGKVSWELVPAGDNVVIKHKYAYIPRGRVPSGLFVEAN
ncbi:hypothetical protein BJ508DRAFT_412287 [Ascobolus immersus RN42]|uniref:Ubiquitin 3 binding protein But2 C-terminal domain-containing protein n=1 Tax=Ascobolus immersus RN42 TaxID=1160509 RepID=A0A3N4IHR2_ASCIM|nr:hypothetical protein BJ508DRAFT_412287 [Ascobolus immersus RN42]